MTMYFNIQIKCCNNVCTVFILGLSLYLHSNCVFVRSKCSGETLDGHAHLSLGCLPLR